jgi:hypothetical protein
MAYLYAEDNPVFFGVLPLKWLFQAIDVSILALFVIFGTIEAYRAFKKR